MPAALVRKAASMPAVSIMPDMLVEVVEQRMDGVARRAVLVEVHDQPVARVFLDQLARREVVLEIDDHRGPRMLVPGNLHIR